MWKKSDKEIEQYSEEFKNILFAKPKPDDNDELRMLKIINSNLDIIENEKKILDTINKLIKWI